MSHCCVSLVSVPGSALHFNKNCVNDDDDDVHAAGLGRLLSKCNPLQLLVTSPKL